jgi:hypothetical protein
MEKGRGAHDVDEAIHTAAVDGPAQGLDMKDARMLEASEVYGDFETAEKYGYVTRGYAYSSQDPLDQRC